MGPHLGGLLTYRLLALGLCGERPEAVHGFVLARRSLPLQPLPAARKGTSRRLGGIFRHRPRPGLLLNGRRPGSGSPVLGLAARLRRFSALSPRKVQRPPHNTQVIFRHRCIALVSMGPGLRDVQTACSSSSPFSFSRPRATSAAHAGAPGPLPCAGHGGQPPGRVARRPLQRQAGHPRLRSDVDRRDPLFTLFTATPPQTSPWQQRRPSPWGSLVLPANTALVMGQQARRCHGALGPLFPDPVPVQCFGEAPGDGLFFRYAEGPGLSAAIVQGFQRASCWRRCSP